MTAAPPRVLTRLRRAVRLNTRDDEPSSGGTSMTAARPRLFTRPRQAVRR